MPTRWCFTERAHYSRADKLALIAYVQEAEIGDAVACVRVAFQ